MNIKNLLTSFYSNKNSIVGAMEGVKALRTLIRLMGNEDGWVT